MAGLREFARAYPEVKIYAISPDSTEEGRKFAQLLASDHRGAVTFPLLSDPGSRVIDRYALRDEAYTGKKEDSALLRRAIATPALPQSWREYFQKVSS